MDKIRGVGRVERKAYSYMSTEQLGPHNDEACHLRKSKWKKLKQRTVKYPVYYSEVYKYTDFCQKLAFRGVK